MTEELNGLKIAKSHVQLSFGTRTTLLEVMYCLSQSISTQMIFRSAERYLKLTHVQLAERNRYCGAHVLSIDGIEVG